MGKSDQPAKRDLLDREFYVMAVAALILNPKTQAPLTIGIYGPWGSGKSSFLKQLVERLPKRHPVANFNPWRLSGGGEVWAGLVNEIAPIVDRHLGLWQRLRFLWSEDATRSVSKLQTRLAAASKSAGNWLTIATAAGGFLAAERLRDVQLPEFLMMALAGDGWLAATSRSALEWLSAQHLAAFKWGGVFSAASLAILIVFVLSKMVRTLLRPFSTQFKANLSQFKDNAQELKNATFKDFEALRKIIGDFTAQRAKTHEPYLVLLIDDLDRCAPDRVVGVLEAVNSFIAELPIITVFAIDTKFVSSAVAARHRFLFSAEEGREARERYGRLFLEKIIHVPFQLAPIRSYERYIEELLTISDDASSEHELEEKRREFVPMPSVTDLLKGRTGYDKLATLPFALMLRFTVSALIFFETETRQRWALAITLRRMFGAESTPAETEWLSNQDYTTQIQFGIRGAELSTTRFGLNLSALRRLTERARQEVLSTTIKIQESDRAILRRHTADLRGNPRSIKRFVNTYLLAKGINTLASLSQAEQARLEDLAAWLVLLQNWPREASMLAGQARVASATPLFGENWGAERLGGAPPPEMVVFVSSNVERLERLATSRGLDIARCFSFFAA